MRLSAFYAAAFLVTGAQLPFWPLWLASRGLSAPEIGVLFAAAIWAKVIAMPALGVLADRCGRRRLMAALAAAAVIGYAAMWPARGFAALLALNLAALTAQGAVLPLGEAVTLAAARPGGLDYGRVRLWGSVSFIGASLAGGAILGSRSGAAVLSIVILASVLLLAACAAIPRLDDPDRTAAHPSRGGNLRAIAGDPRFWLFAAAAAALLASHQLYYGFGTLNWRKLGFSGPTIGALWAEGVAAEVVLFWQGRRLVARFGPVGLMALGGAAGILRWGVAGFVVSPMATAAAQLLHALTFGASYLGAMHYLSRSVPPAAAGAGQSLFAAVSAGFGGGLAMLAAGALYAAWGAHAYLAMAALSAAGLAGALCLRRGDSPPPRSRPIG